jgi:DNA-binding transcriptional regulator YiaG
MTEYNELEECLGDIRRIHSALPKRGQRVYLRELTKKVNALDGTVSRRPELFFDGEQARQIRQEAGLSQEDLARTLGASKREVRWIQRDISFYETGRLAPRWGKFAKKYTKWLDKNGYVL